MAALVEKDDKKGFGEASPKPSKDIPEAGDIDEAELLEQGQTLAKMEAESKLLRLIEDARGVAPELSKARAAKLLRGLLELYLNLESAQPQQKVKTCVDTIEWADRQRRAILKQSIEVMLIRLYFKINQYQDSLQLINEVLPRLKRQDDKMALIEVFLLESNNYFHLSNLTKARIALVCARTTASATYTPPGLQAQLDLLTGILLTADQKDFKTAFSYFFEAFQQQDDVENEEAARRALKYMLLAKIMMNQPADCHRIMTNKLVLEYERCAGLNAMMAIAATLENRSLEEFIQVHKEHRDEIEGDSVISFHLESLYNKMLEENLLKIMEPYTRIQVDYIASKLNIETTKIEEKLSQMILDGGLPGVLDQEHGAVILYHHRNKDRVTYSQALQLIDYVNTDIVSRLQAMARRVNP